MFTLMPAPFDAARRFSLTDLDKTRASIYHIAMNAQSVRMPFVLLALAFFVSLLLCPRVLSQGVDAFQREKMTLRLIDENPQAKSLSFARYETLHRLQSKFGLPFASLTFNAYFVLFPVGRSDRMYCVVYNDTWPPSKTSAAEARSVVACYQRKNGKNKLVFVVDLDIRDLRYKKWRKLQSKNKNLNKDSKIEGLRDYLDASDLVLKGKISRYAESDLTRKQDYVKYDYSVMGDWITVYLTSEYFRIPYDDKTRKSERYNLWEDPFTQARWKDGEFYRRFGLPVAHDELPLLESAKEK